MLKYNTNRFIRKQIVYTKDNALLYDADICIDIKEEDKKAAFKEAVDYVNEFLKDKYIHIDTTTFSNLITETWAKVV